jgi:hypothetical protein
MGVWMSKGYIKMAEKSQILGEYKYKIFFFICMNLWTIWDYGNKNTYSTEIMKTTSSY